MKNKRKNRTGLGKDWKFFRKMAKKYKVADFGALLRKERDRDHRPL